MGILRDGPRGPCHTTVTVLLDNRGPMIELRSRRFVAPVALAVSLAASNVSAASAFVVFEPTREPAPDSWLADVPVTVDWAGVSLRVPNEWRTRVKREPGVEVNGASLLVAFGPGESMCLLDYYIAGTIETWQDAGVQPTATLSIDGRPAERFDDMLGTGSETASAYSIDAGERIYALLCTAEEAPADRWLSIAESIAVP